MELDFALLARNATAAEGELFIHGGGITNIMLPSIPALLPVSIIARLAAGIDELGSSHDIALHVYEPRMLVPSASPPPLPFDLNANIDDPEGDISVILVMEIDSLRINTPGEYRFEIVLDGKPLKELTLKIRQGHPTRPIPSTQLTAELGQRGADEPGPPS